MKNFLFKIFKNFKFKFVCIKPKGLTQSKWTMSHVSNIYFPWTDYFLFEISLVEDFHILE